MVDIHLIADSVIAAVHARRDYEIGEQQALGLAREFVYSALPDIQDAVGQLDPATMGADELLELAEFMLSIDPARRAKRQAREWANRIASLN